MEAILRVISLFSFLFAVCFALDGQYARAAMDIGLAIYSHQLASDWERP